MIFTFIFKYSKGGIYKNRFTVNAATYKIAPPIILIFIER